MCLLLSFCLQKCFLLLSKCVCVVEWMEWRDGGGGRGCSGFLPFLLPLMPHLVDFALFVSCLALPATTCTHRLPSLHPLPACLPAFLHASPSSPVLLPYVGLFCLTDCLWEGRSFSLSRTSNSLSALCLFPAMVILVGDLIWTLLLIHSSVHLYALAPALPCLAAMCLYLGIHMPARLPAPCMCV